MLIAAPGRDLIAADYNAVEARGTAWLANAGRMLEIFSRGEDPYLGHGMPDLSAADRRVQQDECATTIMVAA